MPVPALGSLGLTTTGHDIWVSTNGGNYTVTAYMLPGGSTWSPSPAQIAAQISALGLATATNQVTGIAAVGATTTAVSATTTAVNATPGATATSIAAAGTPLLRKTQQLSANAALAIGASGVGTLVNNMAVNQPSYEASFNLKYTSTSGTIPFAEVSIIWSDQTSGLITYQETYYVLIGTSATPVQTYLTGPAHGNQVTIQFINFDSGQPITLSYVINATSHVYTKALLSQPTYSTIPGFSNPAGFPNAGVLFSAAPTVGFGVTTTRLIASCNSLIDLNIDNNGQPNGVAITLTDPSGTGALYGTVSTGSLWANLVAAGVRQTFPNVPLPNGPVLLNIRNTGASGNTSTQVVGIINNQS